MTQTLLREKLLFFVLLLLVVSSISFSVFEFAQSGNLNKLIESFKISSEVKVTVTSSPVANLLSPTSTPKQQANIKTNSPQAKKECYRSVVVHMDGSTSNLCYSRSDSVTINSLRSDYYSAKTFYEFHIDGANDYQQTYERTGSSIYLDAKVSQEQQAQNEKQKMNSLVAKMQEIERRGY